MSVIVASRIPLGYAATAQNDGLDAVTAASNFLAEPFSPERFNKLEEVTSYLGLAPVVSQSGGSAARARIRPVGQKRLRGILVDAAWQWTWRDPEAKEL
ncbi:MAG: IS110 family transposase [Roseobacter sp.]